MSGEDEERDEREGSRSLHRLVMKALVEKRSREGLSARWRPLSTAAADDDELALVDVPGRRNVWWRKRVWG